jgi:hypothetical protein
MFSIMNYTKSPEFGMHGYQNHATLDCTTFKDTDADAERSYVSCSGIRAGRVTATGTPSRVGEVQYVQFRLMDRYGNYAVQTREFIVTAAV